MKASTMIFLTLFFLAAGLTGCAGTEKAVPNNDKVLIYNLPLDTVYLRTLEALEQVSDWQLDSTEKEKGFIQVRNTNFSGFDDSEKRLVEFYLKRVGRNQTSIQIAPESQHVLGGDKLLTMIAKYVDREVERRQPKASPSPVPSSPAE